MVFSKLPQQRQRLSGGKLQWRDDVQNTHMLVYDGGGLYYISSRTTDETPCLVNISRPMCTFIYRQDNIYINISYINYQEWPGCCLYGATWSRVSMAKRRSGVVPFVGSPTWSSSWSYQVANSYIFGIVPLHILLSLKWLHTFLESYKCSAQTPSNHGEPYSGCCHGQVRIPPPHRIQRCVCTNDYDAMKRSCSVYQGQKLTFFSSSGTGFSKLGTNIQLLWPNVPYAYPVAL